ncbi:ABC transporter ATP-binding protein [Neptunomonas phycophila]|uniref:ABC transporter ATP-binding protein n=1 Tax=Neptunomonas phycophila TaxID=1572645 RepID=UPI0009489F99|nr:ABC transporter ATP-binding protein [Neptunomonas phycophila]
MLNVFRMLLGPDARTLRRYLALAVTYGVLSGVTMVTLIPLVRSLFTEDLTTTLAWLALLLVGVGCCWLLRRCVEQYGVRVGVSVLQAGRHHLGQQIAKLPIGWFTPDQTAKLNQLVTQGLMSVAQLPAHVFTPVILGLLSPFVIAVALFILYWPLGVIMAAAIPVIAGVIICASRLSRKADRAFHHHFAEASQRAVEYAQSQSVLRAFSAKGQASRWVEDAFDQQRQASARLIWLSTGASVLNAWAIQALFATLLIALVLWITQLPGASNQTDTGIAVTLAFILVARVIDSFLEVASYTDVIRNAKHQLIAIQAIFDVPLLPEPDTSTTPSDASVELRQIHFRYTSTGPYLLRDIHLRAESGQMVALVGPSGSGKSTLIKLMARFFDPEQGQIRVGGVDIRQIGSERLSHCISQIFQDTYLFSGSIADNIRLGKPDASDAELLVAAEHAGLTDVLQRLPEGLNTSVGEGGAKLSGGERQRVTIARALIKAAPILLVDEATAALDTENQAIITDTLQRLKGKRTIFVISHQLSTIAMADRIVVLKDGQVIEQGAHDELSAQQGHYAHFIHQRKAAEGWRIINLADEANG